MNYSMRNCTISILNDGIPHSKFAFAGSPVAAQFTVDNTWYRAEIINIIPQSKKAEVQYVDFGNKEIIPFSKIRQLAKEFIRFTIQVRVYFLRK